MAELTFSTNELDKDAWHAIFNQFRDASLMQSWSYAAVRWPRAKLSHAVVTRDGRPIVAAQVLLWTLPAVGAGLAYIHFGPMWQPRTAEVNSHDLMWALQQISTEYAQRRRMSLLIKPQALLESEMSALDRAFTKLGFAHTPDPEPNRFLVDLTQSAEELRTGLHRSWRRNLRQAERHTFDIVQDAEPEALNRFMKLYAEMSARKAFVDNSAIDVLPTLCSNLPTAMRPILFVCKHQGRPLASIVIAMTGESALYLFGASGNGASKLKAGYQLQWFVIDWLRERGYRWYDLGGDEGDCGLYRFKSGLVGNSGQISTLPGEFQLAGGLASEISVKFGFRARGFVRATRHLFKGLKSR